jgi:hypothetical protein
MRLMKIPITRLQHLWLSPHPWPGVSPSEHFRLMGGRGVSSILMVPKNLRHLFPLLPSYFLSKLFGNVLND